jgi:hypothetical protein
MPHARSFGLDSSKTKQKCTKICWLFKLFYSTMTTKMMNADSERSQLPSLLTVNDILNAIDSACLKATQIERANISGGINTSAVTLWTWVRQEAPQGEDSSPSLLYRIVRTSCEISNQFAQRTSSTVTFCIGYSTWDGKILYIDHLGLDNNNAVNLVVYQILAEIATSLHCRGYDVYYTKNFSCHGYLSLLNCRACCLVFAFPQTLLATLGRTNCRISWSCSTRNAVWMVDATLG